VPYSVFYTDANSSCNYEPTDLIAGDFVDIQCYLNYNGSIAPIMDFRAENGMVYTNATINTFPTQVNRTAQYNTNNVYGWASGRRARGPDPLRNQKSGP